MRQAKTSVARIGWIDHDWNRLEGYGLRDYLQPGKKYIHWDKRDGEQGRLKWKPDTRRSIDMIHRTARAGIDSITIGFPTEKRVGFDENYELAHACIEWGIRPRFLARTTPQDVAAVAEIQQVLGNQVEICIFRDRSVIRGTVEGWEDPGISVPGVEEFEKAARIASRECMAVWLGLECASRTSPERMAPLFGLFQGDGKAYEGIVLADTTGYLTPLGTAQLVQTARGHLLYNHKLELHLHDDRGFALANALTALDAGADGIHATWLCMGERMGNVDLVELAVNMYLGGYLEKLDVAALLGSERRIAKLYGLPVTRTTFRDPEAFRTYVGIHARTILKAIQKCHWEGSAVQMYQHMYNPFDPQLIGRETRAGIGPYSSEANVLLCAAEVLGVPFTAVALAVLDKQLKANGICRILLDKAKTENRNLNGKEVKKTLVDAGF